MSNTQNKYLLISIFCALISLPSVSNAAILRYEFTGLIQGLSPSLTSGFTIGETLLGSYSVNTDTLAASDLIVTIGGDYRLTAQSGSVTIVDNFAGFLDAFIVSFSSTASGISGAPVGGAGPGYFDIQLDFSDTTVLDAASIPNTLPLDRAFDRSNINFPSDSERLSYVVTSYSRVSSVPTPATIWLFGAGLIGFAAIRRKNSQSTRQPA